MNTKNWIILQGARGKHDWATGSDITSGQQQAGIVYSGYVSQSVIGWQISHYEKKGLDIVHKFLLKR